MNLKTYRWIDLIWINIYWFGINMTNGTITPVLLPYLVALFVPAATKNTDLATVRVVGLSVAMLIQPLAGMHSDRCTSLWGRRRPYIVGSTLLSIFFLGIIGFTPSFVDQHSNGYFNQILGFNNAFIVLVIGFLLLQIGTNTGQAATQGLIPDMVPIKQRGSASGVKAIMELLPILMIILIGPLVDSGRTWMVISVVMLVLLTTMILTFVFVHEKPLTEKPNPIQKGAILRVVLLPTIFIASTQTAVWLVRMGGTQLNQLGVNIQYQLALVGIAGLFSMTGSILMGVYLGARIGIGPEAQDNKPFIWWIINRLLFLAAIGSIQGFAQFYLSDFLHIPNPASQTTLLLGAVALFLLPSAVGGGILADRVGKKRLVAFSGLIAAGGTFLLMLAEDMPWVILSGCIIGLGAGTFMATNWALGTELVPTSKAGKYLGISNLAGAGAGIVGAGIGGPIADFFNNYQSGLGYLAIICLYGLLFLFSAAALSGIKHK
jgi:MFS family permease